jgi:hypothetical protein
MLNLARPRPMWHFPEFTTRASESSLGAIDRIVSSRWTEKISFQNRGPRISGRSLHGMIRVALSGSQRTSSPRFHRSSWLQRYPYWARKNLISERARRGQLFEVAIILKALREIFCSQKLDHAEQTHDLADRIWAEYRSYCIFTLRLRSIVCVSSFALLISKSARRRFTPELSYIYTTPLSALRADNGV